MSPAQKKLRSLRDKQSRDRQKMAEFAVVDSLSEEQRSALDEIEKSTPDVERQLRAAQVAVEAEEAEAAAKGAEGAKGGDKGDPEQREKLELRSKARFGGFIAAALQQRMPTGAEAEYAASVGVASGMIVRPHIDAADAESTVEGETRVYTRMPIRGFYVSATDAREGWPEPTMIATPEELAHAAAPRRRRVYL